MGLSSLAIGIDVGGTKIAVAVVSGDGAVHKVLRTPTPSHEGGGAVLASICAMVEEVLTAFDRRNVVGIGIGTGGIVDAERGEILASTDLIAGWEGTPVARELGERLGLPVSVDNDGRAFALAEARLGLATTDALCVVIGTGIGGGLILGGQVRRGQHHTAGEFGHLPAQTYRKCSCGLVGHVEAVSSGPSMVRVYQELRGDGGGSDLREVVAAADAGEDRAQRVIADGGGQLGRALAGVVIGVDVGAVVVGGGVAAVGERYLTPLTDALHAALPHGLRPAVSVSRLGPDAPVLGAACLVLDRHGGP